MLTYVLGYLKMFLHTLIHDTETAGGCHADYKRNAIECPKRQQSWRGNFTDKERNSEKMQVFRHTPKTGREVADRGDVVLRQTVPDTRPAATGNARSPTAKRHARRTVSVIPRLHDTTGCQTGLTTGWMFTRYSRLSNSLSNGFDNRLNDHHVGHWPTFYTLNHKNVTFYF